MRDTFRTLFGLPFTTIGQITSLFRRYSCSVSGSKGTGKDMLTANVIERRKLPHVSNIPYNDDTLPFDYDKINMGNNNYTNFITGNVKFYKSPYVDNTDIYLSDCGIYFPAQYCGELNRDYKELAVAEALLRHTQNGKIHTNSQSLNRVYDKIREQSDVYIRCEICKVLFGKIVIQRLTLYNKYQSALDRVRPCRIRVPMTNKEAKVHARIYRDKFYNQYGNVKRVWLVYLNKSKYDTRYFKKLLEGGK